MLIRLILTSALAAALLLGPTSALAAIIQWNLQDDGTGSAGPNYGLRLDSQVPDRYYSVTLGGASTVLTWDDATTIASITGAMMRTGPDNNDPFTGPGAGEIWTVNYSLTGVSAGPGGNVFSATGGSGSITGPGPGFDVINLIGALNGSGYAFELEADGSARGWLVGGGINDWRMIAVPVPEPSTGLLMGLGLIALAARRR